MQNGRAFYLYWIFLSFMDYGFELNFKNIV
jgi:hypothetical protein